MHRLPEPPAQLDCGTFGAAYQPFEAVHRGVCLRTARVYHVMPLIFFLNWSQVYGSTPCARRTSRFQNMRIENQVFRLISSLDQRLGYEYRWNPLICIDI